MGEFGRVGFAETGSREPSPAVSALTGFDPARWAELYPYENQLFHDWINASETRKTEDYPRYAAYMASWVASELLEGDMGADDAREILAHAIATEARRAGTGNTDPVHEGAGREAALPNPGQDTPSPPEDSQ